MPKVELHIDFVHVALGVLPTHSRLFVHQHMGLLTLEYLIENFFAVIVFFFCGSTAQFWALAVSMKLPVSFRLLDLGQSAGLFGRVISSSQSAIVCLMEKP
jgi:hypothetical protein